MSRTYRNQEAQFNIFRKPKHKSALKAKNDEYGIRPGAVPPNDWDDLYVSALDEDYVFTGRNAKKVDKEIRQFRKTKRVVSETI